MQKSIVVGVRMSPEEKIFLNKMAQQKQISLPQYIKRQALINSIKAEENGSIDTQNKINRISEEFVLTKKVMQKQLALIMKIASKTLSHDEIKEALDVVNNN
jgi:transcription initiation factor TFIIIB Brf1 subunit/transcription initiation factor TFIIB